MLLPTAPGTDVPDWFFDRTGGDLKAEFHRTRQARELRETLMTRAYREKLTQAGRKHHKFATIRVRFPEGVLLQGAPSRPPSAPLPAYRGVCVSTTPLSMGVRCVHA